MVILSRAELAKLGGAELATLFGEGRLGAVDAWTAVKGAEKYMTALREGRVREAVWADSLAKLCAKCDRRFEREIALKREAATAIYCGTMGHEEWDANGQMIKCGCLVGLTIGGQVHAAAKTAVYGREVGGCPKGMWE